MIIPEKLYITMTSWYKRIHNVKPVIETILKQTIKPYKIILNLCTEDFPNMEEDLPDDLLSLINEHKGYIELYWFIENYKAWKKHLHTLDVVDDNDLIISVDDDHLYPENFIENMYVSYCFYGKQHPVTLNKIVLTHNMWCFNGPATLYRKKDWGNYKKYLTDDVLHKCVDDIFIGVLFAINKSILLPEIFHLPEDSKMLFNDVNAWTDKAAADRHEESKSPILDLYATTLPSMEDSLQRHYFRGRPTKFIPRFWDIINDTLAVSESTYVDPPASLKFLYENNKKRALTANTPVDFPALGLDIERTSDKTKYIGNNKLIVTISSWKNRINNVAPVLKTILENSIVPDIIVLNLAKSDFPIPDYNKDLKYLEEYKLFPQELIELIKSNLNIQIHWYDDAELKSWKKHLYVIQHFSKDDVIICIDDDILYSPVFIETMIKSYNYYGRKYAISSFANCFCQGGYPFCGYCTLYTPGFFENFDKYMTPAIMHKFPEDNHLLNILNINHHMVLPVIGLKYLFSVMNYNEGDSNFGNLNFTEKWWESYKDIMDESSRIITESCKDMPELKGGWTPNYFNFSIYNLQQFLKDEESRKDEIPFKYVYDSVKFHLENNPGQGDERTDLDNKLKDIIL
jgi:hypothetical protein